MENSVVKVTPITQERNMLIATNSPTSLNLEGKNDFRAARAEDQIRILTKATRQHGGLVFELSWKGNKVPRGANVAGHTIAWTQNSQVLTEDGTDIGSYKRTIEFGGKAKNEQKMIVYIRPDAAKTDHHI